MSATRLLWFCVLFSTTVGWSQDAARPVVIEEFTGAWCGYCYAAGRALDRIEEDYSREEVIIIAYHWGDLYSISYNGSRNTFYDVTGFPTVKFNGVAEKVGGYSYSSGEQGVNTMVNVYERIIQNEEIRTNGLVPFQLFLDGSIGPENPEMVLTVISETGYPNSVRANFLITENHIPVSASELSRNANKQTEFNAVVRAYLGSKAVTLNVPGTVRHRVSLRGFIPYESEENLHPVVFLQDEVTKEIVAAIGVWRPEPVGISDWCLHR